MAHLQLLLDGAIDLLAHAQLDVWPHHLLNELAVVLLRKVRALVAVLPLVAPLLERVLELVHKVRRRRRRLVLLFGALALLGILLRVLLRVLALGRIRRGQGRELFGGGFLLLLGREIGERALPLAVLDVPGCGGRGVRRVEGGRGKGVGGRGPRGRLARASNRCRRPPLSLLRPHQSRSWSIISSFMSGPSVSYTSLSSATNACRYSSSCCACISFRLRFTSASLTKGSSSLTLAGGGAIPMNTSSSARLRSGWRGADCGTG